MRHENDSRVPERRRAGDPDAGRVVRHREERVGAPGLELQRTDQFPADVRAVRQIFARVIERDQSSEASCA